MRSLLSAALLALWLAPAALAADAEKLFDGQSLKGWSGDPKLWSVADGMIVGTTEGAQLKHNTFLATEKTYKDFELRLKFKLRNGNSGVQVRSKQHPNYRVTGYQADIAEKRFLGILYEEGGRGILQDVKEAEVAKHVKPGEWNEYVITCQGPRIKQVLNGFTTVDYYEKDDKKGAKDGVIALQLHVGPPMKVYFKDIEIKELNK